MKFNEQYKRAEFLGFLDGFLPDDFVEKEEDIVIGKPRHKKITKAQILGESKLLELVVLEMEHDSENDPRVTLATDAFKILADHWIHRALVVFKSQNSNNYRLSYLTISLDMNEKSKVIRRYSNARRYSFYLGPGAKVNTPQQQLVKRGRLKNPEDLLSRFSLEVVNKEFFTQISTLYTRLVGGERGGKKYDAELKISGHSPDGLGNFGIRLIGRLVFCWFLKQKKSATGTSLIANELIGSDAITKHSDYYHSICAPLFFEILNRPATRRPERIQNKDLFEDVPYLNGGLFSPHKDDEYKFNTSSGTSERGVVQISDSWFKAFFELLDVYNFTIDENTLVDTELSVDPEMLGRIFENLLAEVNPETGESARKATGSFYTPREIVDYMSDESLVAYLIKNTGIDEKKIRALCSLSLEDDEMYPLLSVEKRSVVEAVSAVTVLDPACGSGAFPIGILQKIVYILEQVDPDCSLYLERQLKGAGAELKRHIQAGAREHNLNYVRKLGVIRQSIFGVDIQSIAVDIARLRCFLTLVVDQRVDDKKPNKGIEPLPNLEFKFVCANTLINPPSNGQEGGLLGTAKR